MKFLVVVSCWIFYGSCWLEDTETYLLVEMRAKYQISNACLCALINKKESMKWRMSRDGTKRTVKQ